MFATAAAVVIPAAAAAEINLGVDFDPAPDIHPGVDFDAVTDADSDVDLRFTEETGQEAGNQASATTNGSWSLERVCCELIKNTSLHIVYSFCGVIVARDCVT